MKLLQKDQLLYFFKGLKNIFVAKEEGKGLSTNDYTTAEKTKLAGIAEGANKVEVDSSLSATSTNPVQNKVVKAELDRKAVKEDVDTALGGKANAEHGIHVPSGGTAGQVLKKTASGYEWAKDNDTVYTHPESHPASMVEQDGTHRFVSDVEKSAWNGKADVDHSHAIASITGLQTALDGKVASSKLGQASGVATLDDSGKVPASQLPSYVDDVLEGYLYNGKFYKESAHSTEIGGEGGKIYVDLATNYSYRWSGSTYIKIESVDITAITNAEIDEILAN